MRSPSSAARGRAERTTRIAKLPVPSYPGSVICDPRKEGNTHVHLKKWVASADGRMQPPVTGGFDGDVGTFEGPDTHEGKPIIVRYTWRADRNAPRWEQAFSPDGGRTWESNWVMEFTRGCRDVAVTAVPLNDGDVDRPLLQRGQLTSAEE